MAKKIPTLLHLLEDRKNHISEQAKLKGESMSAYVSALIDKDIKRVERVK